MEHIKRLKIGNNIKMIILEYVENLINSANNPPYKQSFFEKHKGKIATIAGIGTGLVGTYLFNKYNNPQTSHEATSIDEPSTLTKMVHSIKNKWDDVNRPRHISELTQGQRLDEISRLEQHKALHGNDLSNLEYDSINKRLKDLHRYSDYRVSR